MPVSAAAARLMKTLDTKRPLGSLPVAIATLKNVSLPNHQHPSVFETNRPQYYCRMSTLTTAESSSAEEEDEESSNRLAPMGELFALKRGGAIGQNLVGKTASIRRVFGSGANAQGLLTCGGEELARHASFDPDYTRARGWIRNRAIGQAVLSPVLISGLVGALIEAAFPQSVPVTCSSHQIRPLIVSRNVMCSISLL
jgi:hypothetical protein